MAAKIKDSLAVDEEKYSYKSTIQLWSSEVADRGGEYKFWFVEYK